MVEIKVEKPRITIVVSDGLVQDVYTTLDGDIEVDVLDFDNPDKKAELGEYEEIVQFEQRHIY